MRMAMAVVVSLAAWAGPAAADQLFGLEWHVLMGGGASVVKIRENWSDVYSRTPRSWTGTQTSGLAAMRVQAWGRLAGLDLSASPELGQTRIAGLAGVRWPLGVVEPAAGVGIHYITAFEAASARSGTLPVEEFDLAFSVGFKAFASSRPYLFADCRLLRGGSFLAEWPREGDWHHHTTVQVLAGIGFGL